MGGGGHHTHAFVHSSIVNEIHADIHAEIHTAIDKHAKVQKRGEIFGLLLSISSKFKPEPVSDLESRILTVDTPQ